MFARFIAILWTMHSSRPTITTKNAQIPLVKLKHFPFQNTISKLKMKIFCNCNEFTIVHLVVLHFLLISK